MACFFDEKSGRCGLFESRDAAGVGTEKQAVDGGGQGYGEFFRDLVILDDVDGCIRREDGDAGAVLFGEEDLLDFDDVFESTGSAFEIEADGDLVPLLLEFEEADDFEGLAWGDVVDHGSVFDRRDGEGFSFHSFLKSMESMAMRTATPLAAC